MRTARDNRTQHHRGRRGFTLVELLVVIFILAIIVGMIVGVGALVYDHAWKSETRKRLAIIMDAIDSYYSAERAYPRERQPSENPAKPTDGGTLYPWGYSLGDYEWEAYWRNYELVEQLMNVEVSRVKIAELPTDAIDRTEVVVLDPYGKVSYRKLNCFVDGRDRFMDYRAQGGLGGRPVVISAGRDGQLGSPSSAYWSRRMSDNIRSDTR